MSIKRALAGLLVALVLGAAPAWGLTVDQVVALRKAGVSNQTIQLMIQHENRVRLQGGVGRYVVKQMGGRQTIVYQASSPSGVEDYPISQVPAGGQKSDIVKVLSAAAPKAVSGKARARSSRKSAAALYTLHLSSFRDLDRARKARARLEAKGVQARLATVDLPGKGRWHRLLLGRFSSREQARAEGEQLKQAGRISSFRILKR